MGRPRKTLRSEDYEAISRLGSRGVTETSLAQQLGLTFKTWKRIRDEDPQAKAAYEAARGQERDSLVGKLFEAAMSGNITAAIFLLKARHQYRDIGPTDGGTETRATVQLFFPSALSPNQYHQLIDAKPTEETP